MAEPLINNRELTGHPEVSQDEEELLR